MNSIGATPSISQVGLGFGIGTSNPSFIINPSEISSYTFVTTCLGSASTTAGNYLNFKKNDGSGQYQVAAAKTFYSYGFLYCGIDAAGPNKATFGYATATFANDTASASTPTGWTNFGNGLYDHVYFGIATQYQAYWVPLPMRFPASSYPGVRLVASLQFMIMLVGREL